MDAVLPQLLIEKGCRLVPRPSTPPVPHRDEFGSLDPFIEVVLCGPTIRTQILVSVFELVAGLWRGPALPLLSLSWRLGGRGG